MAGCIDFSNGETWYTNQWGWRTLWRQAVEDASSEEELYEWRASLVNHGLFFHHLDEAARRQVARALLPSVEALVERYVDHPDEYERGYSRNLGRLADLLRQEATATTSARDQ